MKALHSGQFALIPISLIALHYLNAGTYIAFILNNISVKLSFPFLDQQVTYHSFTLGSFLYGVITGWGKVTFFIFYKSTEVVFQAKLFLETDEAEY